MFIIHPTTKSKIEIADKDLDSKMTWEDANNFCSNLGESWRLPTTIELDAICKELHSKGEGNFTDTQYWSSTTSPLYMKMGVYNFQEMTASAYNIAEKYSVRPVRNFLNK